MNDAETPLRELKERIADFARERDWNQFHSPKNLSMALAAEAAELMEHFLWKEGAASLQLLEDPRKAQCIREEVADIIIYALEFANVTGLDVTTCVVEKMRENARKYPVEKARGRSEKYTEL